MVSNAPEPQELSGPDQRYFPRWEVSNRVVYQSTDSLDLLQGETKDLSCSGACLRVPTPIDQNTVKLTIFLSKTNSIQIEGQVCWNREHEDDVEVGVSFHNVSPKVQDLILQYAFEVKHDNVVDHWFDGWNDEGQS